jgi:hypothetical protein
MPVFDPFGLDGPNLKLNMGTELNSATFAVWTRCWDCAFVFHNKSPADPSPRGEGSAGEGAAAGSGRARICEEAQTLIEPLGAVPVRLLDV